MSYYENANVNNQWPVPTPTTTGWDNGAATPVRTGASAPQPQDDYAFSYQFDEVDRAHENVQKSGKGYGMNGRGSRGHSQAGSRPHSVSNLDDPRAPPGGNLHNFYANQRHQPSRNSNDPEQIMQTKRRLAAQRERELRNLHTEQQYQRNVLADVPHTNKHMSEEETRELIARQRSALYGEGPFADKSGYVDENGNVRTGAPGPSGPSSIRGHSPLAFDNLHRGPPGADSNTPGSADNNGSDPSPRPQSTTSPQTGAAPSNKVFDSAIGPQSRTSASSPTGGSPPRDLAPGSKPGQPSNTVAPIGTRPVGTPGSGTQSAKRSTTPLAPGWGRGGSGVWGQSSSGLGTQASVWG